MRYRIMTVAICLATLLLPVSGSADDPLGNSAMKGLTGVRVLISLSDLGSQKLGLLVSDIQTDIELKLRLSGMTVITKDHDAPGVAFLVAHVNIMDDASAANVSLTLDQDVSLYRPQYFGGPCFDLDVFDGDLPSEQGRYTWNG